MSVENLISIEFTDDEKQKLVTAFQDIALIMENKGVSLTKTQRRSLSKVKYEMEVWINKTSDYMQNNLKLVPAFIDMLEHNRDREARKILNPLLDDAVKGIRKIEDTNILLGNDLYFNCMAFYRAVREAAKSNASGAAAIYKDLKQQFPGKERKEDEEEGK